mgnify:CR=1 FL=1
MHPIKFIRKRLVQVLKGAEITVGINGRDVCLKVFDQPPSGGEIPERNLPGLFCFAQDERRRKMDLDTIERVVVFDLLVEAKSYGEEPLDTVDDIYLQVESALVSFKPRPDEQLKISVLGSKINVAQGEVKFAARRISCEVTFRHSAEQVAILLPL